MQPPSGLSESSEPERSFAQAPPRPKTLQEMCREMRNHPEFLEDREAARLMLDGFIRERLQNGWGVELSRNFEEALKRLKLDLKPCEGVFSEVALRRIIGTEIAWLRETRNALVANAAPGDIERQRQDFINEARFGVDPLCDEDSPTRRMGELDTYLRSWKDFPAFGFGIGELDDATGGVLPGEICVVTGAPGTMKTSLALAAVDDFVTRAPEGLACYFSVDMAPREVSQRLMERHSRIPQMVLRAMSERDDPELSAIRRAVAEKYDGRLTIRGHSPTRPMTIDDLLGYCLKRQPQLAVIDYFTRLKPPGCSDLEFVENAMPKILAFAHQYQASFIVLSQMSRSSRADQASGKMGGHGKGGGIVEELAHTEIELFQQHVDGDKPMVIAAVAKARRGVSGRFFSLSYDGPTKRFDGDAVRVYKATTRGMTPWTPIGG